MTRRRKRGRLLLVLALCVAVAAAAAGFVLSSKSRAQSAAAPGPGGVTTAPSAPQPGSMQARADLGRMQSLLNTGSVAAQAALLAPLP